MPTLYRINRHSWDGPGPIAKVEIERETKEMVFLPATGKGWNGTRARKEKKNGDYFATFDEAKAELIKRRQNDVERANDRRSVAIQALQLARAFDLAE